MGFTSKSSLLFIQDDNKVIFCTHKPTHQINKNKF